MKITLNLHSSSFAIPSIFHPPYLFVSKNRIPVSIPLSYYTHTLCIADTVSSSSGVYSGAGSEGSNSPDSHHVARLLVTQGSDVPLLTARRHSRDHPPAAKEALSAGGRSDLLLAKAAAAAATSVNGGSERGEVATSSNCEASAAAGGGGGGQFPKCGRRMVERANSRVANLSGLVRLPFARLPSQQQQQQHQHQLSAAGNGSRQLREF